MEFPQLYFESCDVNNTVSIKLVGLEGFAPTNPLLKSEIEGEHTLDTEVYLVAQLFSFDQPIGLPITAPYRSLSRESESTSVKWDYYLNFPVKYKDLTPHTCLGITVYDVSVEIDNLEDVRVLGGTTIPVYNSEGRLRCGREMLRLSHGRECDPSVVDNLTPFRIHRSQGQGEWWRQGEEEVHALERMGRILNDFQLYPLDRVDWMDKLVFKRVESQAASMVSLRNYGKLTSPALSVILEFPNFRFPLVFSSGMENDFKSDSFVGSRNEDLGELMTFTDMEMDLDNPIEDKYYLMSRSHHGEDKNLKPKIEERNHLYLLVNSPSKHLSAQDKNLLWKFRYSLIEEPKALTKLLRSVHWNDADESKLALQVMNEWKPIDVVDALELLSKHFASKGVREYAVKRLAEAPDSELLTFLLQLVQALRFEDCYPSPLSRFLVSRSVLNSQLGNFLYWYLTVEEDDSKHGNMFSLVKKDFLLYLDGTKDMDGVGEQLSNFSRQEQLMNDLLTLADVSKMHGRKVFHKVERMRELLGGEMQHLTNFTVPVPMPVRPSCGLLGLVAQDCSMFKSAMVPLKLAFRYNGCQEPSDRYNVIFKTGDDLRQDQLIIQMINLMDGMLKAVGLDLKLTPYRVLAISKSSGFVEFVPNSRALSSVLANYNGSINSFLSEHCTRPKDMQIALETFIKSSAGYCVITYLLGVGDRHLDNLMMDTSGHLFHIDFGWIFGFDPKPFPTKMRIIKEMIDAMGGFDSVGYKDFLTFSIEAFRVFRRNANLIMNLLQLMSDAGIEHLSNNVDATLLKVQERFRLDLSDDAADDYLVQTINECVGALFPAVLEIIHKLATDWR